MLCYRFSCIDALEICERLIFRYGKTYYCFDSLLLDNHSNHKRHSRFSLKRWLSRGISLASYGSRCNFPDTIKQYLEDIPIECLVSLCHYHSRVGEENPIEGDTTKFGDVILD